MYLDQKIETSVTTSALDQFAADVQARNRELVNGDAGRDLINGIITETQTMIWDDYNATVLQARRDIVVDFDNQIRDDAPRISLRAGALTATWAYDALRTLQGRTLSVSTDVRVSFELDKLNKYYPTYRDQLIDILPFVINPSRELELFTRIKSRPTPELLGVRFDVDHTPSAIKRSVCQALGEVILADADQRMAAVSATEVGSDHTRRIHLANVATAGHDMLSRPAYLQPEQAELVAATVEMLARRNTDETAEIGTHEEFVISPMSAIHRFLRAQAFLPEAGLIPQGSETWRAVDRSQCEVSTIEHSYTQLRMIADIIANSHFAVKRTLDS